MQNNSDHLAGGAGGSGCIADHLFVEQRGDGIWLVCVEKVHSTREQAQASCREWQALTRGAIETDMKSLVNRFLTWPVPASVYPDGTPGQPGRTGTNLLTASEALEMLTHVLAGGAGGEGQAPALVTELLAELLAVEAHLHAYVEAIEYGGGSASKSADRLASVRAVIAKTQGRAA